MAAGLLAILFAFGVFAPAGVDAGVKGTPPVKAELSSNEPEAEDVVLTITFELSGGGVDGSPAGDNLVITVPNEIVPTLPAADSGKISITQGGPSVGSIVSVVDEVITFGQPDSGEAADVIAGNVLTTVIIKDLTLADEADSQNVSVAHEGETGTDAISVNPSVTVATAKLVDADDTDGLGPYDAGAAVSLVLSFETNTDAGGATDAASVVTIVIDDQYDVDLVTIAGDGTITETADDQVDTNRVSVTSGGAMIAPAVAEVDGANANALTAHSFTEDTEIEITITGLTNPTSSDSLTFQFKQGNVPADATGTENVGLEGVQQTATVTITDTDQVGVMDFDISDIDAGTEGVTLSFNFRAVIDGEDDPPIMIRLNDDFVLGGDEDYVLGTEATEDEDDEDTTPADFLLYQMVDGERIYVYGEIDYDDTDRDGVSITLKETTDAEKWQTADSNDGNIYVEIRGLTNPPHGLL